MACVRGRQLAYMQPSVKCKRWTTKARKLNGKFYYWLRLNFFRCKRNVPCRMVKSGKFPGQLVAVHENESLFLQTNDREEKKRTKQI